jgi:hypothetical protein
MSQRFSEYARRERDDYPTPDWVTKVVIPQLAAHKMVWEPAAGNGGMATALRAAGFEVAATDLSGSVNFLDERTWPPEIGRCDTIVTNPPCGVQGKLAEQFIAQAPAFTKPRLGAVAMLLKIDFDSGSTRRPFFAGCPAWAIKLVLTRRIMWFESTNGMGPSENHAWYIWSWQPHDGPRIFYGP